MNHRYDVIIVGAGSAGLRAALELSSKHTTAVLSKVFPTRSHTGAAQGGINAALCNLVKDDTPEKHMFDTIKGSDYLGDQDAIEEMCIEAPELIRELEHLGVLFSRFPDGTIAQRPIGRRRACHAGDYSGHVILHSLWEQCLKKKVKFYSEFQVLDLVFNNGCCCGIVAYEIQTGEIHIFQSKCVVLATGGYGRAYKITTNAHINTGDGLTLVYNKNIPLEDMEFVQFHPSGIYKYGILITEGSRAEGGYLINGLGERFMERYAPSTMETAPRDLVARAISREILEGRGINGQAYVHLDLSHLGEEKIQERLPQIRELAKTFAFVDPIKDPIPIQTTCHYSMGGIPTNKNGQVIKDADRNIIPGLFAAGECACVSVHGANRLGGNSLLEAVYFGRRSARTIMKILDNDSQFIDLPPTPEADVQARLNYLFNNKGEEKSAQIRLELQESMMLNCGVFRDSSGLKKQLEIIKDLKERFKNITIKDKSKIFNTDLTETIELENLLQVSEIISYCALLREESRGAHFRTDFEKRDDKNWLKHSLCYKSESELPTVDYKPVVITKFPPKERTY